MSSRFTTLMAWCTGAALAFLLTLPAARAQDAPVEWGEVPREDLEMTSFPADTNATAVILADYGAMRFRHNGEVSLDRHTRIKILSRAGYDHATVEIPFFAHRGVQDVRGIDGQTFVLEENGEVTRHELDSGDVFEEDIDGRRKRMRFTLPALEPGAVVEYRYEFTSENPIDLPIWYFQHEEPTRHSEYRVRAPHQFNYTILRRGMEEFDVENVDRVMDDKRYRWVMRDVPALREEPFMTTPKDFRARMDAQLTSINLPDGTVRPLVDTWQTVSKALVRHDSFGDQIGKYEEVAERAEAVTQGLSDPTEKMNAIYDFVRSEIEFNGDLGFFPNDDLDDVLAAGSGNSAANALLLTSMLESEGFSARPVVYSTREHGRVHLDVPVVSQFNDVIVRVRVGGEQRVLDATDPLRPSSMLPTAALDRQGLLIRPEEQGGTRWLQTGAAETGLKRSTVVNATLATDGSLEGTLQASDQAYSALDRRRYLAEDGDVEAMLREEYLSTPDEVEVESATVENRDDLDAALGTKASFRIPAYAQAAGDFLYVNPMVAGRWSKNPFQDPERSFPVNMTYPRDLRYTLLMQIPEGYVVDDAPENVRVELNGESQFQRLVRAQGQQLSVQFRLQMGRYIYPPERYGPLRVFFDRLVAAHAEQVVLKRASAVAEEADAADGEEAPDAAAEDAAASDPETQGTADSAMEDGEQ